MTVSATGRASMEVCRKTVDQIAPWIDVIKVTASRKIEESLTIEFKRSDNFMNEFFRMQTKAANLRERAQRSKYLEEQIKLKMRQQLVTKVHPELKYN